MINVNNVPPITYLYTQLHVSDPTLGVTYSTLVEYFRPLCWVFQQGRSLSYTLVIVLFASVI